MSGNCAMKSARHAVNEIGPHAVEVVQILLDLLHVQIGPPRAATPAPRRRGRESIHDVRVFRPMPDGLDRTRRQRRDRAPAPSASPAKQPPMQ